MSPTSPPLPLRPPPVGVAHPGADEVLEHGVAVEAAAVLAELDDPRPDGLDRRVDRDRPGGAGAGPGVDEVVAGPSPVELGVGGAPSLVSGGSRTSRRRHRPRRPRPQGQRDPARASPLMTRRYGERPPPGRAVGPRRTRPRAVAGGGPPTRWPRPSARRRTRSTATTASTMLEPSRRPDEVHEVGLERVDEPVRDDPAEQDARRPHRSRRRAARRGPAGRVASVVDVAGVAAATMADHREHCDERADGQEDVDEDR